ncbi:MAG: ThuA domain-containing protein [Planctomycetota bacterium]|nr:ThuA domain-containing protein [Planctomycetota bacterium]
MQLHRAIIMVLGIVISVNAAGPTPCVEAAEGPIRVVVWDEQQPTQKEAYDNFLGNCIADHLQSLPGFEVRSLNIKDAELGLSTEILDFAEVMFWWGHVRQADVTPEVGKAIVERVKAGRLTLVALHSAHWSTPFIKAMNERAWLDLRERSWADLPATLLSVEEVPAEPYKAPNRDSRLTPATDVRKFPDGRVAVRLHLPNCCFPGYRSDGKPSQVRVLDESHPLTAGLPATFSLPRTEMYDEPFHVPAPDHVLVEECWEPGEWFRSVMLWELGQGQVVYIRPGHETFPVYKDAHMLRLIENAARFAKRQ